MTADSTDERGIKNAGQRRDLPGFRRDSAPRAGHSHRLHRADRRGIRFSAGHQDARRFNPTAASPR